MDTLRKYWAHPTKLKNQQSIDALMLVPKEDFTEVYLAANVDAVLQEHAQDYTILSDDYKQLQLDLAEQQAEMGRLREKLSAYDNFAGAWQEGTDAIHKLVTEMLDTRHERDTLQADLAKARQQLSCGLTFPVYCGKCNVCLAVELARVREALRCALLVLQEPIGTLPGISYGTALKQIKAALQPSRERQGRDE